jgi:uncharacterized protein (DUF488 family)
LSSQAIELFTIGYEGKSQDDLVAALIEHDIDTLIDVRFTPWSRKHGFRRTPLSLALADNAIGYVHIREFGSAPALRKDLKESGDWGQFSHAYSSYLHSLNGAIAERLAPFAGRRICLLCLEASHQDCHRSILADEIADLGVASKPFHL